ncbi:hypothetical protein D3C81_849670 [compost metagenome]
MTTSNAVDASTALVHLRPEDAQTRHRQLIRQGRTAHEIPHSRKTHSGSKHPSRSNLVAGRAHATAGREFRQDSRHPVGNHELGWQASGRNRQRPRQQLQRYRAGQLGPGQPFRRTILHHPVRRSNEVHRCQRPEGRQDTRARSPGVHRTAGRLRRGQLDRVHKNLPHQGLPDRLQPRQVQRGICRQHTEARNQRTDPALPGTGWHRITGSLAATGARQGHHFPDQPVHPVGELLPLQPADRPDRTALPWRRTLLTGPVPSTQRRTAYPNPDRTRRIDGVRTADPDQEQEQWAV